MEVHKDERTAEPFEVVLANRTVISGKRFGHHRFSQKSVIINSATGVPARYYEAFARWLASSERAWVYTYDYSGCGSEEKLRKADVTMMDWALRDQASVLEFVLSASQDRPVEVVGHSLGGLCIPYQTGAERLARITIVASGPAFWLDHPLSYIPKAAFFWWLGGPVATALYGYLPGKRLGLGANLPKNVFWQWRKWCLSRDFNRQQLADAGVSPQAVKCPITLIGIDDDEMITPTMVQRLACSYPEARTSFRSISPSVLGIQRIGHVSLFSASNANAWPQLRDFGNATRSDLF